MAPPANLAATAGDTQVSLSWPAAVQASSYHVKRADVGGGPYETLACVTSTSYVDSGLQDGAPYYYVVSAAFNGNPNAGGESVNSSEASATPQANQPPPVPTAPTKLTAKATKPKNLDLQWVQATTAGVTKNRIYRKTGTATLTAIATISAATAYRDSGLSSGTNYCYAVSAINSSGVEGALSTQACASPK
jgi:cellulose 1,4-beta-cellobiosidase